ncbi:MAG: SMI1/KNR4 family protein [Hyphomicrobiaceae bacterium]|nr:SMI1/KNR4 family protein [Hyphomicrobiaceae bacterium]
MTDVAALILRMERWLSAHRPDYHALLQPGATDARLDAFEGRFSLRLPDGFRHLYRWRDGQDPMSSAPLYLNRTFSTLEEVAETKDLLDGMIGSDFAEPAHWRRGWVPFLHNGGGSHLCLDLAAEDGGTPGQLVAFWKADRDRPVEHPDLETWLATLVAAMEDGCLRLA